MTPRPVCPGCGARLAESAAVEGKCPSCGTDVGGVDPRRSVVVAHESHDFLATTRRVLDQGGFHVYIACAGDAARVAVERHRPDALVMDVALPDALPFVWIPELRADPEHSDLRIVLVASVYDRTAYKRKPRDLHGADDYIEQHHVPDALVEKIEALLEGRAPPPVHRPGRTITPEEARLARELEAAARRREERIVSTGGALEAMVRLVLSDLHLYEGGAPDGAALDVARDEIRRRLGGRVDPGALDAAVDAVRRAAEEQGRKR